jgi:hypothetical protein
MLGMGLVGPQSGGKRSAAKDWADESGIGIANWRQGGRFGAQRVSWPVVFRAGEGEDAYVDRPLPRLIQNEALKIRR